MVAVDQFQNVDSNYRGTVQFTSSDAQATFAHALHVFTADDAGVFTAGTVTLKTAASQTITVKDALVPTVSGTSTAVTVHPAAPAIAAFVQQPTNTTAGVSITPAVTVNVQDAFANNVPGASVTLSIAAGFNPGGGALTGAFGGAGCGRAAGGGGAGAGTAGLGAAAGGGGAATGGFAGAGAGGFTSRTGRGWTRGTGS